MSASFDFETPDVFTAGTVGPVGKRVFYIQARESGTLVTLELEKEQVNALAEHLARLLARLSAGGDTPSGQGALLEPITPAWAVGSLGVAYDATLDRIVIVAEELVEEGAESERATARFRVSRAQAASFVKRARELVRAGRPPCPICGGPMDSEGHVCPRRNGHGVG